MGDTAEPTPATEGDAPVATAADEAQPDMDAIVAELDAADAAQGPGETATSELPTPAPVVKPEVAAKPKDEVTTARARRMLAEAERKERGAALSLAQFKQQLAGKIRENPNAGLAELGLDTDTIIDAQVNAKGDKPKTVEEQLAELKGKWEASERERANAQLTQQVEAAKTQRRADLAALGDKFPRLNCANAEKAAQRRDVAIDFMIEYHAKHGVPLPVATAARMTNDFFDDGGGTAPRAAAPAATSSAAPRAVAPTLANTGGGSGGAPAEDDSNDADALYERALAEINRM